MSVSSDNTYKGDKLISLETEEKWLILNTLSCEKAGTLTNGPHTLDKEYLKKLNILINKIDDKTKTGKYIKFEPEERYIINKLLKSTRSAALTSTYTPPDFSTNAEYLRFLTTIIDKFNV